MDRDTFEQRLAGIFGVVLLLFGVLGVRLWQVQIVQGDYFARLAQENRLRVTPLSAARGVIVDRAGRPLVVNRPAFTVAALPLEFSRPAQEIPVLARLLGTSRNDVASRIAAGRDTPFAPVRLRRDASETMVASVEESQLDLPGVFVEVEPVRYYPYHDLAAHLVGYLGEVSDADVRANKAAAGYGPGALIGKDGLEREYDRDLRGRDGEIRAEVDALGRPSRILRTIPAVPGDTLVLGLDLPAQQAAEEALGDRAGVVVALDPATGAIRALASHPTFDPNAFATAIPLAAWKALLRDTRQPLLDRVVGAGYPTGSVFKIVTASAALDLGIVNRNSGFHDPGYLDYGGRRYHDNNHESFGAINFLTAIAVSSNVVFWTISQPVGAVRLAEYAHRYGLGARTGVDLPNETAGVIPSPAWKRGALGQPWYGGDTLNMAVGQGYVLVSPIQAARMVAAVANGGTVVTPHAVTEIRTADGRFVRTVAPPAAGEVRLRPETLATIREGLAAVVSFGTAASIQIPGLAVSGKTGTAESPRGKPYAWFGGYAPAKAPTLVVVAMVENAGYGAQYAGPIVRRVFEAAFGLPLTPMPADPPKP